MRRVALLWAAAFALSLVALLIALSTGSVPLGLGDVSRALVTGADGVAARVVLDLRLPRALAAFGCGGLLALAGALMQILLRNPLADPYVLGLAGGAAVGALAAMLGGGAALAMTGSAGAGALASVALVLLLARRDLGKLVAREAEASPRLLLAGMSLAIAWSAIVTLILTLAPEAQLRGMLFWLVGDLAGAQGWAIAVTTLVIVLAAAVAFGRDLNVLAHGPATAQTLGVPVVRLRWGICIAASAATAAAVITAGPIGFVGLIVPHALRIVIGNDQRVLLPLSAAAGGVVLLLADTLARTAFAPLQLPAGVVTALAGVPVFLALLLRDGGRAR